MHTQSIHTHTFMILGKGWMKLPPSATLRSGNKCSILIFCVHFVFVCHYVQLFRTRLWYVPSLKANILLYKFMVRHKHMAYIYWDYQFRMQINPTQIITRLQHTIHMFTGRTSSHTTCMYIFILLLYTFKPCCKLLFPSSALVSPLLSITSGSSWLYVEWNDQSATFRVLYRESGAPDYQVIVPITSQLSHNISALQPNALYSIVVEARHTVSHLRVNSSVTRAYTTPQGE